MEVTEIGPGPEADPGADGGQGRAAVGLVIHPAASMIALIPRRRQICWQNFASLSMIHPPYDLSSCDSRSRNASNATPERGFTAGV